MATIRSASTARSSAVISAPVVPTVSAGVATTAVEAAASTAVKTAATAVTAMLGDGRGRH